MDEPTDYEVDGVIFADATNAGYDGDAFAFVADDETAAETMPDATAAAPATDEEPINANTAVIDTAVSVSAGDQVIIALDGDGVPTVLGVVGGGDYAANETLAAQQWALQGIDAAEAAQTAADEAAAVAAATSQHFWHDTNGAHVTEQTQEQWTAAVHDGFSDLSDAKPYHNVLINSLGMLLRSALNNLVSITRSAVAFFDSAGDVIASFGTNGATIGKAAEKHITIDSNGLDVYSGSNLAARIGSVVRLGVGYGGLSEAVRIDPSGNFTVQAEATSAGMTYKHAFDIRARYFSALFESYVTGATTPTSQRSFVVNDSGVTFDNEKLRAVHREEFSSGAVNWSGGTIGTRAAQNNVNIEISGWTPVSVCISYVQASATFHPVVFFANTASTSNYTSVYCNFYRCTTAAYSHNTPLRFTVTYIKD